MSRATTPTPATPDGTSALDGAIADLQARASAPRLTYRLDDLPDALGVSRRTIERERSAGRFPKPDLKIGKCPLWTPETIRRWIESGGSL